MRWEFTGVFAITAVAAFGQTPPAPTTPAPTTFEVASVRVSQAGKSGGEGSRRENVQYSPDSVTLRNVTFRSAIRWAYHVMDYQITGPDWMATERYDIAAKSATQVTEDQLRVMLQGLLAERFKLALHRVTKDLPAFVLLVGKNGPKFTESASDGEMNVQPDQGRLRVTVQRAPVSQLVDGLSQVLRAPVIDQTGLKGKYDITLDVAKYIPEMEAKRAELAAGAPFDISSIIMTGVQEELGLKLESKKVPLDLLIVDHAEKVPTEN